MTGQENGLRGYMVRIKPVDAAGDTYDVWYVPHGLMHERGIGGDPKQVPEYRAQVQVRGTLPVRWDKRPAEGKSLEMFENDARTRANLLNDWLRRLSDLIQTVQGWAKELGWSTKVVEKPMEDSGIGNYRTPALLLQEEATKILLEPVARSSPGTEGVVDLYLMPGYEDIASVTFHQNSWHITLWVTGTRGSDPTYIAQAKPLSKDTLLEVLDELKSHAG